MHVTIAKSSQAALRHTTTPCRRQKLNHAVRCLMASAQSSFINNTKPLQWRRRKTNEKLMKRCLTTHLLIL